ncbi:MAG: hypothetical protein JKY56_05360 [Kofleriaceae bacterium]|nr:hypothetical protein [Kofleriaceae bacterium]
MRIPQILLPALVSFSALGVAAANPTLAPIVAPNSARAHAESLEAQGKYKKCGEAYYTIYVANPIATQADELLYNSGVCFQLGGATGLAIRQFGQLTQHFPQSSLAPKALLRAGALYDSVKYLDKACNAYEEFAKRYSGEKEAPSALMNAIRNRRSLGHHKEMVKNIERFVRQYGKRHPEDSDRLLFLLATEQEKQGFHRKTVQAYERYLKVVGKHGGLDRSLVVNAKLGEFLWQQSCVQAADGVCSKRIRLPARKKGQGVATRCGSATTKVQIVPRNRKLVVRAMQHFANATALANAGAIDKAPDAARSESARDSFLASQFYLLALDYEKYLSLGLPRGLSFPPTNRSKRERSAARFQTWLQAKKTMSGELNEKYQHIASVGRASEWKVASIARIGQISQHFAMSLATAEVPKGVRQGKFASESVNAFCDEFGRQAQPLRAMASTAYSKCVAVSAATKNSNTWSNLCQRELAVLHQQKVF